MWENNLEHGWQCNKFNGARETTLYFGKLFLLLSIMMVSILYYYLVKHSVWRFRVHYYYFFWLANVTKVDRTYYNGYYGNKLDRIRTMVMIFFQATVNYNVYRCRDAIFLHYMIYVLRATYNYKCKISSFFRIQQMHPLPYRMPL